jgi:hypothetical protein
MKKIKHFVLLFVLIISADNQAQVQTASICSLASPIAGNGTTSNIDQQQGSGWLSFVAQKPQQSITVTNIINGNTIGKITKVKIYEGTCSGLILFDEEPLIFILQKGALCDSFKP